MSKILRNGSSERQKTLTACHALLADEIRARRVLDRRPRRGAEARRLRGSACATTRRATSCATMKVGDLRALLPLELPRAGHRGHRARSTQARASGRLAVRSARATTTTPSRSARTRAGVNVDVKLVAKTRLMPLAEMRDDARARGHDHAAQRGNRLSITPVTPAEWKAIEKLAATTLELRAVPIFLALGAVVGFMAGLLGIGGGFTIVPVLRRGVLARGLRDASTCVPMAIGTSAATIVFTAFSSARAHHARGAVDWADRAGDVAGHRGRLAHRPADREHPAARDHGRRLRRLHLVGAWRMLRNSRRWPSRQLPGGRHGRVGAVIGMIAGMVGTGGAFLAVPFMTRCNVKLHAAVATSAAIGIPVAIAATVGFMLAGWGKAGPAAVCGRLRVPARARRHRGHEHAARAARRARGARVAGRPASLRVRDDAVLPRRVHVVEGVPLLTASVGIAEIARRRSWRHVSLIDASAAKTRE